MQALAAVFFVSDIVFSVLGIYAQPISWQSREFLELGAALGLILGVFVGAWLLLRTIRENRRVETRLRRASGAFLDLMEQRFAEWGLTPAEREVALFALKGFGTGEIAELRSTSDGTVKAQTNAVYRKAGVSGRPQLLSLFIDDLIATPVATVADDALGDRKQA